MKKILMALAFAVTSLTAYSQPNPKFTELENYLNSIGFGTFYWQINTGEGILYRMKGNFIMTNESSSLMAQDSIRKVFSNLSSTASESYLYEFHKGERDTIDYSIAFAKEDEDLYTKKYHDGVEFHNFREMGRFHCRKPMPKGAGNSYYFHDYYRDNPLGLSYEQLKPLDGSAFEQMIQSVLKEPMKKGVVKSYPIYWQVDEGYEIVNGYRDIQHDYYKKPGDKQAGVTTGTVYDIPLEQEDLAMDVFHQLDSMAFDYVNAHPEQLYTYYKMSGYTTIFLIGNICQSSGRHFDEEYYTLCPYRDVDGFHIISITSVGNRWFPKERLKIKSWINGERVERKK